MGEETAKNIRTTVFHLWTHPICFFPTDNQEAGVQEVIIGKRPFTMTQKEAHKNR